MSTERLAVDKVIIVENLILKKEFCLIVERENCCLDCYFESGEELKKRLFSFVKIQIDTLNHARLIEKLRVVAPLFCIRSHQKSLSFWVKRFDESKIIDLLNQLCYNYSIKERVGLAHNFGRIFSRIGTLIGIVISVAMMIVYPRMVLSIVVNEQSFEEQTKQILSDMGIQQFDFKWKIDCEGISQKLLALDGISYAKAQRRGTTLFVELQQELEPPEFLFEAGKRVVSKHFATVTRAVVFSGTAVVDYGDVVKAGDVLIENYILVQEKKVDCVASGEVFGKIYVDKTCFFPHLLWTDSVGREYLQERTARLLLESTLTNGETITNQWFEHSKDELGCFVKVTLECEVKIN